MLNVFMKYGMIIVGIAVTIILLTLVVNVLQDQDKEIYEFDQELEADDYEIKEKIIELCDECTQEGNITKECFLLKIKILDGYIDNQTIDNIKMPNLITEKTYDLKIINNQSWCEVKVLG